jgi:hypothetical protein
MIWYCSRNSSVRFPGPHPLGLAAVDLLLDAVRQAFVGGVNMTLWVSAALMAATAVLAIVFRPGSRNATAGSSEAPQTLAVS